MRFSQGCWKIFEQFVRLSEPSYGHAAMFNLQEDGMHVDEVEISQVLDYSRYDIVDRYWREGSSVKILMKDGLLRDEGNWKWRNEIIRNVNRRNKKIRLVIKIYQAKSPSVAWSEEDQGFVLCIPESNKMDLSDLVGPFKKQILSAFDDYVLYQISKMQDVKAPSELLLRPPYYLSIQADSTCITVQSSHSLSLKFLAKYLREHCRRSRKQISAIKHIFEAEGPPVIDIKLHQNPFTPKSIPKSSAESSAESSAIYDTLTLKADLLPGGPVNRISPLILVRLVENELGYEIDSSDQNSWSFIRREPLEEPLEEPPKTV